MAAFDEANPHDILGSNRPLIRPREAPAEAGQTYGMKFNPSFANLNTVGDAYTALLLNVAAAQAGATGNKFIQDWQVGGTSKMVITEAGNLGIGTTTPGYTLRVAGTAWVTSGA